MVSKKLCLFNFFIFLKLVQIVSYSPFGNEFDSQLQGFADNTVHLSQNIVSVHLNTTSSEDVEFCDGFIISPEAILTSAQCFYNKNTLLPFNSADMKIELMGSRKFLNSLQVKSFVHPKTFDMISKKDDIGILYLENAVLKDLVKPIELHRNKIPIGSIVQSINLDTIFKNTSQSSFYTKVHAESDCLDDLKATEKKICAYNKFINSDSALFLNGKLAGFHFIQANYENPKYLKAFLDTSQYYNWIQDELKKTESDSSVFGIIFFLALTAYTVGRSRPKKAIDNYSY